MRRTTSRRGVIGTAVAVAAAVSVGLWPAVPAPVAAAPVDPILDVELDVDTVTAGTTVTLTARIFDAVGSPLTGPGTNTQVRFSFQAGSANEPGGNAGNADLQCHTGQAGTCFVTYLPANVGVDVVCAKTSNGPGACTEAVDAPERADEVDAVQRTVTAADPSPNTDPGPSPTPSPDPSSGADPSPGVDPTPGVDPSPSPSPSADPSPSPSPGADPSSSPDPTPGPAEAPSADPSPSQDPSASPSDDPSPAAVPVPSASPEPSPSQDPSPGADPTLSPAPSATPIADPTPSPAPSATPIADPAPSPAPSTPATPDPSPAAATPDPSPAAATPDPSPAAERPPEAVPSSSPSAAPEQDAGPTAMPSEPPASVASSASPDPEPRTAVVVPSVGGGSADGSAGTGGPAGDGSRGPIAARPSDGFSAAVDAIVGFAVDGAARVLRPEAAATVATTFGFPLALALLVLLFLLMQSRLDDRDPKLRSAPMTTADTLLGFEDDAR